jgi:hypothetical protein
MLIYFKPMNTLFSLHKSRCYIISSLLLVLLCFEAQAQLVRVIDNKGTIANVRNNQVTTALTAPTTPLEGDIWFDSTTAISKVWDGTTWKVIDTDVVTVANMAPTSPAPVEGDIWFNNTNPNTIFANVWNGAVWQPIQNSWLGNTTIHHTITTVLAITQALHNNTDIHIESTGDLSLTSTDVSDATNFYITNTTAADRTLSFTGFTAAYLRNGGPITDLSGGLTLKANTRYLAHITENSGNFYFNATEAGGGESGAISDEDSDTKIQVEEGTDDDTIRFDTAGIERAVIDAAGNIGIGGVANPQAELHFSNILDNRKLILWQNNTFTNDEHQFYGFGINGGTLRYQVPQVADHVFFGGTSSTTSNELIRIKGTGNVGIGGLGANNIPYTLTVSGTAQVTGAIHDSDGDAGTSGQVLSSTVTGTDWINTTNTITNEMIFDGEDDTSGTYDDYYYISMLINGTDWKVVRYDKTDVNAEAEAMGTGAGNQPITLADCIALTF